jgi:hypothetical protein
MRFSDLALDKVGIPVKEEYLDIHRKAIPIKLQL